ncbi:MAG: NUDIX hydrolase [Planctomycetota bacterium]
MHRRPLLAMLARYERKFPAERDVAARIRRFVATHPDCFQRSCVPGHVTGSAWVVSHDHKRCLLVHHRKLNRWLQPGGHTDGQSDVAQAALREAIEESGIAELTLVDQGPQITPLDLDVHLIPARRNAAGTVAEPAHEHHDVRFLVLAGVDDAPSVSDESHEVRWFSPQEATEATQEESVLRMMRKAEIALATDALDA